MGAGDEVSLLCYGFIEELSGLNLVSGSSMNVIHRYPLCLPSDSTWE